MDQIAECHRPGWEHETRSGTSYIVWAPREGRRQWQASWQNEDETAGDFRRGDTLDDVLVIFPAPVSATLRRPSGRLTVDGTATPALTR